VDFAAAHPDRIAAVVPVAGGGHTRNGDRLKNLPVWVFHGARDETVPIAAGQAMVDAVRAAGGNVEFTILPNGGHGICAEVYERSDLYEWLLAQRRKALANAERAK
jgi:predicted peptidase